MGYIRHDAIIVTAWDSERIAKAAAKADELGLRRTEIVDSKTNGYASMMIVPDGSKEGWADSDEGEIARAAWIKWARESDDMWMDWALVNYGGDEPEYTRVIDHNGILANKTNSAE